MTEGFLPGCYRNFPQEDGESLAGYLLRLANANGYDGLADMLKATIGVREASAALTVHALRQSKDGLSKMSQVAVGNSCHLLNHLGRATFDGAMILDNTRVDDDAWLLGQAQVCPRCLAERDILLEDWDLALVTACTKHSCLLLDECQDCGSIITWNRTQPTCCEHCGAAFKHASTADVSSSEADVAGDFAAKASFRFRGHGEDFLLQNWDAGFRVFKGLALTRFHWASVAVPNRYLRNARLTVRHRVTKRLAVVRRAGIYHLGELACHTERLLEPLGSIPKPAVIREHAMRVWHGELGTFHPLAKALSSSTPFRDEPAGHEVFHGRPPSFYTNEAVASFLGVNEPTVYTLIKEGKIAVPPRGQAFDIDEILHAQRFLRDGLLTLAELAMLFGIPLFGTEDIRETYLPTWNPRNKGDKRIELGVVLKYHLQLMAKFDDEFAEPEMVSLGKLASQTTTPIETLIRSVVLLLNGNVRRFTWKRPYRWSDLLVSGGDSALILAGAQLVVQP